MQKILIIQTAFIGDVILATSLIEKLYAVYPEAQIDFVLRKGNEGLLENHPFIHKVWIWDKKKNKHRNFLKLLKQIRLEKYDAAINAQRFFSTGVLTAFSAAKIKIGFDKNPLSFLFTKKITHRIGTPAAYLHETDRNNMLIAEFTGDKVCRPQLYPSIEDFKRVEKYKTTNYICIAPTSVWFTKQFPGKRWVEFIQSLEKFDGAIYLLGGNADNKACEEIKNQTNTRVVNLAGQLSLLQTAALMQGATMNYVNDSAPMHIASSMNAPVAAIYCSTVPYFGFGPLSDKSYVIETEKPLDCRPCGLHGFKACPKGHFHCANNINIQDLKLIIE